MNGEIRYTESEVNYLQHADGFWSLVGRDGWPMDTDEYVAQLADLDADVEALSALGVTVIDAEPASVRDIPIRKELPQ